MSWFENEKFWTALAPIIMFGPGRAEQAIGEAATIAAHLRRGSAVLDLGCGMGHHVLRLVALGFLVTAVDLCPYFLDIVRRRAQEQSLALDIIEADMRVYRNPCAFDAALSLGTTFGFFEDAEDDSRVIHNLHECLRPDGLLVMDMVGKETMQREFEPRKEYLVGEATLSVTRRVLDDWTWVEEQWTFTQENGTVTLPMCYRPYSAPELQQLLREHGFRQVQISGDLTGRSKGPLDRRLVAFARK